MTNCKQRAEECRRRAGTDHWAAFLEMAETWEKLAALREYGKQLRSSGVLLKAPARPDAIASRQNAESVMFDFVKPTRPRWRGLAGDGRHGSIMPNPGRVRSRNDMGV